MLIIQQLRKKCPKKNSFKITSNTHGHHLLIVRGIANGKDLPIEYLESLYDKIVLNEIKLNSEELFVKVVKKGWLKKMGRNNRWQRHWFVVANNCLYYFATPGVCE